MEIVNHLEGRLRIAVPKKGRLQSQMLDLLSGADIDFHREPRLDIALAKNLHIALIFLNAADIPTFVGEGRVDLGITGRDQVAEHDAQASHWHAKGAPDAVQGKTVQIDQESGVEELLDLGFGACKLQVQVPVKSGLKNSGELVGKKVVTSFTGLSKKYFAQLEQNTVRSQREKQVHPSTKIQYVSGSVEAACALGVADAVIDLVESGETMRAAGLRPIDTIMQSTAVLVKSRSSTHPLIPVVTKRIQGILIAKKYVMCRYNIPRALLPFARKITPAQPSQTIITGLENEKAVSVSAVVDKKRIAGVMDGLSMTGATDIFVVQIMNSREIH